MISVAPFRSAVVALLIGVGAQLHAQVLGTSALRPGALVRFRAEYLGDVVRCDGRIASFTDDTLEVGTARPCAQVLFPRSALREVEVAQADHGSRLVHTGAGLLIGTVAGGVVGRLVAGNGCSGTGGCDDGGLAIAVVTIGGMGLGALIGTVVGVSLPAGIQWRATGTVTAIRVEFRSK